MKKFKFIAFIFAIMTTMPILQSCLDDDDNSSDLLAISVCSSDILKLRQKRYRFVQIGDNEFVNFFSCILSAIKLRRSDI